MKNQNFIVLPLVFVAGIVSVVALQAMGLLHIGTTNFSASEQEVFGENHPDSVGEKNRDAGLTVADAANDIVEGPAVPSNAALQRSIENLQTLLRETTIKTDMLESEISQLNDQIENAAVGNEFLPSGESPAQLANVQGEVGRDNPFNRNRFAGPSGDEQYEGLISAGVDPSIAVDIKQRSDRWELQRLELVDQASREGWRRSDRFDETISELREERPDIRSELGDDQYDRYLFASGQSNRVQISNIIDGSAAQNAGLEVGDVVISYASSRVFTTRDLQRATREGLRDEPVQVDFLRGQQTVSVQLPRGPLGVSLSGLLSDPADF